MDQGDEVPFPVMSPAEPAELTDELQDKQNGLKQEGSDALEDGKKDVALEKFSEAIGIGCASALLYSRRAILLMQMDRPRACVNDCNAALLMNPDSAKAMKARAKAYLKLEMWEEAHADFQTALKIDFDDDTEEASKEVAEKVKQMHADKVAKRNKEESEEYNRKLQESKKAYEEGLKANEEKFREQRMKEEEEKKQKEDERKERVRKREEVSPPETESPQDSPLGGNFLEARENEEAKPEPPAEPGSVMRNDTHLQRLAAAIQYTQIRIINPPREGKKLLVIDLDYCIFDCKSSVDCSQPIEQCKRPFTDQMLAQVYPFYDLVVWSQTKWHWVEAKLTELGLLTHPQFSISWCMDRSSMFTVTSLNKEGEPRVHEVKALEVIWAKFPVYGPHNTVHIDDLSRNFAMNPQNGIQVTPFRVKHCPGDVEMEHLTAYLLSLVSAPDLSQVDHTNWKRNFA